MFGPKIAPLSMFILKSPELVPLSTTSMNLRLVKLAISSNASRAAVLAAFVGSDNLDFSDKLKYSKFEFELKKL